jgi:membrane complex biogenesis BtpA family protein
MSRFYDIFANTRSCPVIGVVHLPALPGAPSYEGDMPGIVGRAVQDFEIYQDHGLDGVIIENFGDAPFYPGRVPAETVAAMTRVAAAIIDRASVPVGLNVLRNDAESALGVAAATGAAFIRVNVHTGAVVADQGVIEGRAHDSLRLRESLKSDTAIFADIGVKHASPLGDRELGDEAADTAMRGRADALIVTGTATGTAVDTHGLAQLREKVQCPFIIGSGVGPDSAQDCAARADAMIVGSALKTGGQVANNVDAARVRTLMNAINVT